MSPRLILRLVLFSILAGIFLYAWASSRRQEIKDTQKFCPSEGMYLPCEWVPQETEA